MKYLWASALALCLLAAPAAHAQQQQSGGTQQSSENCEAGSFNLAATTEMDSTDRPASPRVRQPAVTNPKPAAAAAPTTEAERYVQDVITDDGLHVVHFWAPWCPNSTSELADGWRGLVAENPDVTFTFVTVWNDGEKGASVLDEYDLPDRVTEVTQPDLGPSDNEANRRQSFLTHPVTWIPSTWIFHNNGELAFAMNYGEMEMSTIQALLDATRKDW